MAKVSIIIPIYNVEAYIKKSVGSVIDQTERDIEIILVDDGSTDNSGLLCDKYAEVDSRIKVIHKKNGGLSSARNAGIEVATAKYVQLLDGDDYLRVDAIEQLLKTAEKYPSDIIQFHYQEVTPDEVPVCIDSDSKVYQSSTSRELFENLYRLGGGGASVCTKLVRRELLQSVPFVNIQHEDEMWCTQAFVKPLTVTYIADVLYYYVMRDNSIVHSKFNRKKLDVFQVIKERICVLHDLELDDLIHYEYKKQYLSILQLYCLAKRINDTDALRVIKNEFICNKVDIIKYARLDMKFSVLSRCMSINYGFISLYELYWKIFVIR